MLIRQKNTQNKISSSNDIIKIMTEIYNTRQREDIHKECFYSIGLNAQNKILFIDLVTMGSVNVANPIIREVLRQAIVKNASCLIVTHNHPSGTVLPSEEDKLFTKDLKFCCDKLGIKLLDHVILGDKHYSFADEEIL